MTIMPSAPVIADSIKCRFNHEVLMDDGRLN